MAIDLPFGFNRLFKGSAILDQVFTSTVDLNNYLTSPVRYAGMVVALVEGGAVSMWQLDAAETAWEEAGGGSGPTSTGILNGGVASIGAPTSTFSVSDGTGMIVDTHTDPENPVVTPVSWTGLTNVALTNIAAGFTSIAIDINGVVIQRPAGTFTLEETRDYIIIGALVHLDGVAISTVSHGHKVAFGGLHGVQDLARTIGPLNDSGNVYSAVSVNELAKSLGTSYVNGGNYYLTKKNPDIISSLAESPLTFNLNYRDGASGFTILEDEVTLAVNIWDDGTGTPAPVGNKYTIQRIFFLPASGISVVHLGQALYNSSKDAVSGITSEAFERNPDLGSAILRGYIIAKGDKDLLDGSTLFIEGNKFGDGAASGFGGASSQEEFYIRQLQTFEVTDPANWFTDSANVTTAGETGGSHIDGIRSALMTQSSAILTDKTSSGVLEFSDAIYKERRISAAFEFDVSINSGKFRVDTVIFDGTADRVVNSQDLNVTSKGTFRSEFSVGTLDEYCYFDIVTEEPDDLNTFISDNFRIDLAPAQVKKIFNTSRNENYIPSLEGVTSTSNESVQFYRRGDRLFVDGFVTGITPTATAVSISLPPNLSIDTAKSSSDRSQLGKYNIVNGGAADIKDESGVIFYNSSNLTKVLLSKNAANDTAFATFLGSNVLNSGDGISFNFSVPILNWENETEGTVFASDIDASEYDWQSYTPSFSQALGTPTFNLIYRRDGGDLLIDGSYFCVGPNSSEIRIALPDGLVASGSGTTKVRGSYFSAASSDRHGGTVLVSGGHNYFRIGTTGVFGSYTQNPINPSAGDAGINPTSERHLVGVRIPIQEWSANPIENLIVENPTAENKVSARIQNNGTASVLSFDADFIESVSRTSLGFVTVTFKTGYLDQGLHAYCCNNRCSQILCFV